MKIIEYLQKIINAIRARRLDPPVPHESFVEYLDNLIGFVNEIDGGGSDVVPRLVRVIEVPLVADENEDGLVEAELGGGQKSGATKEPVRGDPSSMPLVPPDETDDEQTGVSYKLSDTAGNLWTANEVVAEFTDENGRTHYSPLAKKALADMSKGGNNLTYSFVFDSGDTFECENADDYPMLVDTEGSGASLKMTGAVPYGAGGGGTGGGVLVVNATLDVDGDTRTVTLDKTWQEIKDATAVSIYANNEDYDTRTFWYVGDVYHNGVPTAVYGVSVFVFSGGSGEWYVDGLELKAASANDYPSVTIE